jgi:hypothetical protein
MALVDEVRAYQLILGADVVFLKDHDFGFQFFIPRVVESKELLFQLRGNQVSHVVFCFISQHNQL